MGTVLALDIGGRRTGVAMYNYEVGIPMPLDTLTHISEEECVSLVADLAKKRGVERIFIGLPLLPSGKEGSQARAVRSAVRFLKKALPDILLEFIDERFTTPKSRHSDHVDNDASAACSILRIALEKDSKRK